MPAPRRAPLPSIERREAALRCALALGCATAWCVTACGDEPETPTPYEWDLPEGFPLPLVPEDNPISAEKVALGRRLFYDERLSANQTQACATCHEQQRAFTENRPRSIGSTGEEVPRNSLSLTNAAYASTLTWTSPLLLTLEQQIHVPMFGENPVELGITGNDAEVLGRFANDETYQAMFEAAFPDRSEPSYDTIIAALASFVRTLVSGNSPYDRYAYQDDPNGISESARRGGELFFSERLECHHCHGGFNFSQATKYEGTVFLEPGFANTGLYNTDGNGAYPAENRGLIEFTGEPRDMGKFRAPTLRNVAVTPPYFHDGSAQTLDEVLRIYEAGGRVLEAGEHAGDGRTNPYKSGFLIGFSLTEAERADVLAFLESLTDEAFLTDPQFSDPGDSPPP
jgi:cytochrome c peroxidase